MWARFPKLWQLELRNLSHIEPETFEKVLRKKTDNEQYFNQIKHFSNKIKNKIRYLENTIAIERANVVFGVWVGDKIIKCKAEHVSILALLKHCSFVESPFNAAQQLAIIGNVDVEYSLSALEIDGDWNEFEEKCYNELLEKYSNDEMKCTSVLFVVSIPHIWVPISKTAKRLNLNITINDFRPLYSLEWNQFEDTKEFEDYIDLIDDSCLLEVSVKQNLEYFNSKRFKQNVAFGFVNDFDPQPLQKCWRKLLWWNSSACGRAGNRIKNRAKCSNRMKYVII